MNGRLEAELEQIIQETEYMKTILRNNGWVQWKKKDITEKSPEVLG